MEVERAPGTTGLPLRLSAAAGLAAVVAYAIVLGTHASHAAGGADSSGYLNAARSLSAARLTAPIPMPERLGLPDRYAPAFIPLGYVPSGRPREMASYYPPGLPLHMAAAAAIGGWREGPFWVAPVCAAVALLLTFALGRDLGLPWAAAAAGAGILAAHPAFLFEALQPMSDVPATAWSLAVVICARRSRRDFRWAVAAGAAFGVAFLVRPAGILLLFPILPLIAIGRRRLAAFAAGGLLPFLLFVAYNLGAFHHPLSTGYGRGGLWEALAFGNFPARARHYGHWLSATLTGLVLLGWLVAPADRKIARSDRAMLFLWFAAFFVFYAFYGPYEAWWYLRFLLPAFPPLILAFLLTGRHALEWLTARVGFAGIRAAGGIAIVIVLGLEMRQVRRLGVTGIAAGESTYPEAAKWAESAIPKDAFVIGMQMSGALRYSTALAAARWDSIPPEWLVSLVEAATRKGFPTYALLFPFETAEVRKRIPGPWTTIDTRRGVSLWRLDRPGSMAAPAP